MTGDGRHGRRGRSRSRRAIRTGVDLVAALSRGIGVLLLILALNYGLGWAWDSAVHSNGPSAQATADEGKIQFQVESQPPDPRQYLPQMKSYPWAHQYFAEFHDATVVYHPYLLYENGSYHSRYLNLDGIVRRSWEPKPSSRPMPTVAFYGGSTTWGEGQRDDFTVPSMVAKLAAQAGLPIHVVNYGVRGWGSWEEMLLFEQRLAAHDHEDLAVFYDGLNDCNPQQQPEYLGYPADYDIAGTIRRLASPPLVNGKPPPATGGEVVRDYWTGYQRHSLFAKVLGKASDLLASAPAGAEPLATTASTATGKGCLSTYERARSLRLHLAATHHLPTLFYWQPERDWRSDPGYDYAATHVDAPTINITDTLDRASNEVFIDGGHTNELGADLVARRMFQTMRVEIAHWYATHG